MHSRQSRGFTLVELLVVIAIIGILMALLLPAVQAARRTARKAQCASRMSQMALATLSFHDVKERFPGHQEWMARDASRTRAGGNKPVSTQILLLPHLDMQPLYDLYEDTTIPYITTPFSPAAPNAEMIPYIDFLTCPSRAGSDRTSPVTSFMGNSGFMPRAGDPAPYDVSATPAVYFAVQNSSNGIFLDLINQPGKRVRMADIHDGSSSTIMFSENLLGQNFYNAVGPVPSGGGSFYSVPVFAAPELGRLSNTIVWLYAGETNGTHAGQPAPVTVPPLPQMKINGLKGTGLALAPETARPSSNHSSGVNVAMADKSTRFLSQDIDYHVYQSLLTPYNRKSAMPLKLYNLKDTDFK